MPSPIQFQPSQLCISCQALFTGPEIHDQYGPKYTHSPNIAAVRQNAADGCALCAWIDIMCCRTWTKPSSTSAVTFQTSKLRTSPYLSGDAGRLPLSFSLIPWDTARRLLELPANTRSYTDIGDSNDCEASQELAGRWINTCWSTHTACNSNTSGGHWVPSRLLQINFYPEDSTQTKLVRREAIETGASYVALSHRWGTSPLITLNGQTKSELEAGIPLDRLPTTFRDATRVCGWFGFRYLWIDSLCIMQDSRADWLAESHAMKSVYSRAAFTIAAGAGVPDEGLFARRDPKAVIIPQVETTWQGRKFPNGQYCVIDERLWKGDVDNAPLSKRAWVVQERFLSPRTLFFGAHQMFFECCEMSVCESLPAGKARGEMAGHAKLDHAKMNPQSAWRAAAAAYSEAELTKYEDKVIALAGMAETCRERLNDEYIVGLWRKNFAAQLCWTTSPCKVSRPSPRIAPSWSWLSINGSLRQDELFETSGLPHILILQVSVDLSDKAVPTGHIQSAFLRLRCQLKPASWHNVHKYGKTDFRRYQVAYDEIDPTLPADENSGPKVFTNVDVIPAPEVLESPIYLMPVTNIKFRRGGSLRTVALVLRRPNQDEGGDVFERIGCTMIHPTNATALFQQTQIHQSQATSQVSNVISGMLRLLSGTSDAVASSELVQQDIVLV